MSNYQHTIWFVGTDNAAPVSIAGCVHASICMVHYGCGTNGDHYGDGVGCGRSGEGGGDRWGDGTGGGNCGDYSSARDAGCGDGRWCGDGNALDHIAYNDAYRGDVLL